MTQHRRSRRRGPAAAVLVSSVVLAGAACSSGASETAASAASQERPRAAVVEATPAAALLAAAQTSSEQTTVRTATRLSLDGEVVLDVEGVGAADGSSARITATVPVLGEVPVLVTPDATFVGVPGLPDGAEWLRISPEGLGLAEVLGPDALEPPDPQRAFDLLRDATDEATEVGTETVDGIETTRYRFDADLRSLLDDAVADGSLPPDVADELAEVDATAATEVWIDADGLVRRLRSELRAGDAVGVPSAPPTVGLEFDFADYGEPVDVAAPDPATVVDASRFWPLGD